MGSANDLPRVQGAVDTLRSFDEPCEVRVLSAHRTPHEAGDYFSSARKRGIKVIICAAGGAAHLAGVAAAHTTLPVLGIPLDSSPIGGLDALMSTVQMPPGIPVATMAVGSWGATNAALFALSILALQDESLTEKLSSYREKMRQKILTTEVSD